MYITKYEIELIAKQLTIIKSSKILAKMFCYKTLLIERQKNAQKVCSNNLFYEKTRLSNYTIEIQFNVLSRTYIMRNSKIVLGDLY